MASVRDIARQTNLSITTVSRVLNNHPEIKPETRARVLSAVNRVGYVPNIGKRVVSNVGLVYTSEMPFSAYDATLMAGMLRGLAEHKLNLTVVNIEREKTEGETYSQFFVRKGLRGAIVRTLSRSRHICEAIANEGLLAVVVAERFEKQNVNYICCQSRDASRKAVEHLIHLGHRRIGLAVHQEPDADHLDRQEGYKDAMAAAGLRYDPELVFPLIANFEGGAAAMSRIMSLPVPPTAVYFTDPLATVGAMARAQAMGLKIPNDLSVVGFDDGEERKRSFPPMTAVVQNVEQLGHEAALWMARRITGLSAEPLQRVLETNFEVNLTTGLPAKDPVWVLPDGTRMPVRMN